jgi:hypothetical protein
MSRRYPVRAITHVHTAASNGPASEMDDMIGGAIRRILGPDTPVRWSECFTTVERLRGLLGQRGPEPLGIIAVTDHMNAASHRLPDALLAAAAAEPRLAACGELNCVDFDVDGALRRAPEVLVYGGPEPVDGPFGPHFGLSQQRIEDLYARCRADGSAELQTSKVLDYCAAHGLACGLAHPFDGHALSLEATFDLISRARIIETVNGGYPAVSSRILEDLVAFQNRLLLGQRLPPRTALRFPQARRLAERICAEGRSMLHPWGGSDAHSHNFDRVTMRFLADRPDPTAGDLFAAMLRPIDALLLDGTFTIQGCAGSGMSVLDDVVRIVCRNMWSNRRHLWHKPLHVGEMVRQTGQLVHGELSGRAERQAGLIRDTAREFDFGLILREMAPARQDSQESQPTRMAPAPALRRRAGR